MKRLALLFVGLVAALSAACSSDADVASRNVSKAADNFEVQRRVVFYNGITGEYLVTIEGLCSLGNHDTPGYVSVTCKVGPGLFKKHFLGLSDNVTFVVEQLDGSPADTGRYRVVFKPSAILPDMDIR